VEGPRLLDHMASSRGRGAGFIVPPEADDRNVANQLVAARARNRLCAVAAACWTGPRPGQGWEICAHQTDRERPVMADMQVIVGSRNEARCASITCMIRHYVSPKGRGDL
jgi:hypothetical protein